MRYSGSPSWRLSIGDDFMLSAALWIRDAAGVVVDTEAMDVPPPYSFHRRHLTSWRTRA